MANAHFRRRETKLGALLQLAVFLLLQLTLILPPIVFALGQSPGSGVCHQDHALCGCSPARIAAGTCCCAQASATPSCCRTKVSAKVPTLTVLPCGKDDPVVISAIDNFLLDGSPPMTATFEPSSFPLAVDEKPLDQCDRPPLPPPKYLLLS